MPIRDLRLKKSSELLEQLFSRAESQYMNWFSRKGGKGYGGGQVEPWSREFRLGVLKIMGFHLELWNLDYYERSLKVKSKGVRSSSTS